MIKNFCNEHWASEKHGDEPTRKDGGDRDCIFAPEGETCSYCPEAATHTGPVEDAAPDTEPEAEPEPAAEEAPKAKRKPKG